MVRRQFILQEDLIKESGKVEKCRNKNYLFLEWRLNKQGQPVFKLSNNPICDGW